MSSGERRRAKGAFAAMMALIFFVVLLFCPETKGVTLAETQHRLGIELRMRSAFILDMFAICEHSMKCT